MEDMNKKYQQEYFHRIHKVQDYISEHLSEAMTIDQLAEVAGFSKYHFSRIFQALLGESPAQYVNRIRMENAVFMLAHRQDKNMTDVAYDLGFTDSAIFSRAFKKFYGISPRSYRQEYSTNCKEPFILSSYNKTVAEKEWKQEKKPLSCNITIELIEEKEMVYVRHTGNYEILEKQYGDLMETLFQRAEKQQLLKKGENWVLAIYHDNPEFGEQTQFRTSLCLTVPRRCKVYEDGILGQMKLKGGIYVVGHFKIQKEQYSDAWDYMYKEWLTGSGYVPRNADPFEVYRNIASEDENHMHHVDIYVPIEPLM